MKSDILYYIELYYSSHKLALLWFHTYNRSLSLAHLRETPADIVKRGDGKAVLKFIKLISEV